jgi:hypothetical protein
MKVLNALTLRGHDFCPTCGRLKPKVVKGRMKCLMAEDAEMTEEELKELEEWELMETRMMECDEAFTNGEFRWAARGPLPRRRKENHP